jgi:hypothetical protein
MEKHFQEGSAELQIGFAPKDKEEGWVSSGNWFEGSQVSKARPGAPFGFTLPYCTGHKLWKLQIVPGEVFLLHLERDFTPRDVTVGGENLPAEHVGPFRKPMARCR